MDRAVSIQSQDHPSTGLYGPEIHDEDGSRRQYLGAIAIGWIPKNTLTAINFKSSYAKLHPERIKEIQESGIIRKDEEQELSIRVLRKGWQAVLDGLISQKLITREQAIKHFKFYPENRKHTYPQNFIHMDL